MARIIESRLVISGEDKTAAMFDSIGKRADALAKNNKMAASADNLVKSLDVARKQMEALDKFATRRGAFDAAQKRLRDAEAMAARQSKAVAGIAAPNRAAAEAEQRRLGRAVDQGTKAYESQKSAVLADRRALEQMGIPIKDAAAQQGRLRSAVMATTVALEKQHAAQQRRTAVAEKIGRAGAIVAGGVIAGRRVKQVGTNAVVAAAEFDIATRKQREFTDISAEDQANILTPQAKKIGQDTQFTNVDVVKAQTKAMQGLPSNLTGRLKAEVAEGILENVKNYALVMEADLETAAEAVRSYLQTTGKDISTKEKALFEANKAVNQLVKMAKLGGMNDEDVQDYMKFALPSATAAGVTPESGMALGALARRGGLRGSEAGVFVRAAASKLVAPTKGGRAALNAAGINYSDYVKMPESLDVDRLEGQFKQDLGIGFTPEVRAALQNALSDPAVIRDRGAFTQAVTGAVEPLFGKKKDGSMRASDRQKIAKTAGTFHKVSASSVDVEGLLDKIMSSNMTLAQLNEFFTPKHGGKASITQQQRTEYVASRNDLKKVGDDPDFAKRKADEIMGGLGGEFERLKGSVENLNLAIGESLEKVLKPAMAAIGATMDWISNLNKQLLATGAVTVGAASIGGATWLTSKLMGGFGLSASAVALDQSAALLTAAATRLGGGAPGAMPGGAAVPPGKGAPAAGGPGLLQMLVPGLVYQGGSWVEKKLFDLLPKPSYPKGYDPEAQYGKDPFSRGLELYERLIHGEREITGTADIKGEVEVKVTVDDKRVTVTSGDNARLSGSLPLHGPGNVGKSSPDALPGWRGTVGYKG